MSAEDQHVHNIVPLTPAMADRWNALRARAGLPESIYEELAQLWITMPESTRRACMERIGHE